MATIIHAGDHDTDCGTCQQNARIKEGLADYMANPAEYNIWELEDIFEDRDPFEFI